MATDKPLLLSAILENIEVQNWSRTAGSQYFVRVYVANKVAKSKKSKPQSSVLKLEWDEDESQIWFEPSSTIKVILYRKSKVNFKWLDDLVGQHEDKVVDLLENNAGFDLTDKDGNHVHAKMKIVVSPTSDDDIKKFMENVDADVSRLSRNDGVMNTLSTLGQVLKLTKTFMDHLTQAHPILNLSWTIVSSLYQAVQERDIQDESIRELAASLREMLATANAVPDLHVIPNTTNVIEEIGRQSLEVASLIHEYTKLPLAVRTVKNQIPGALKSRVDPCRKSCAVLKDMFYSRLQLDTNIRLRQYGRRLAAIENDELAHKIHKWLSPPDSSRNRNEAHGKRQVNTCSWFLEGEQFLRWREKPGFLWIKGNMGCGKTVLCSSIIDTLPKPNSSLGIAYFFFDGRDGQTELQLHNKLIRSLISQFSDSRHGGIPTELADLYKSCGVQQALDDQLQETLRDILNGFSHAYIVIDALDECTDREKTLTWVNKLVMDMELAGKLHIAVTSRPEPDIKEIFGVLDPDSIDVGEATANKDITKYLKLLVESRFNKYDENTRMKIESGLTMRAEGSFRWVALQLAELEKCASTNEITKQLAELPEGLDEIYKRILKKVDKKYVADTRMFLEWLAFSKRPMKIAEIAETITVDFAGEDGPVFMPGNRYADPRDVLVRCSSLVIESKGTIKLSHFSVKEYLLSTRIEKDFSISEKGSHSKISEVSVAYLLQFDSFMPLTEAILESSPLAKYAAVHWINHAKSGGMDTAVVRLILKLFRSESATLTNWIRMYHIDGDWDGPNLSMDKAEVHSPLYYASLAGLQQVSEHLLEKGADVNMQGGGYGNALQAASYFGHEGIVKLLLEKGADVKARGGYYGNALHAASQEGHEGIVKLLVEKGADVNAQEGAYGNVLQAVSYGGEGIVKLLVEKGADVNAQGGDYGNALQAASYGGDEGIVKLLVEKGADVNAQGGFYGNALQAASYTGDEGIVKLLVEKGADVNAQGGYYGSALLVASYHGQEGIVKLLVLKGGDVNAQGGKYGNALQAASYGGHEEMVMLLVEKGADVNAQGGKYGNALQAASYGGHEGMVMLLLEKGADVNAQGGYYGNALQAASYLSHEGTVKLLVEKGADVNAQGGYYGNALQAASYQGHDGKVRLYGNVPQAPYRGLGIVKLLVEMGADVNAQGGEYGNALQAASHRDHVEIVKLLLEKGADVNAMGGRFGNALETASYYGLEAMVMLLVEKGADVNAQGGQYGNALQAAASYGDREGIVKLLLRMGVDVNAPGGVYGHSLQAASYQGNEGIVMLLLEKGADVNAHGGKYGNALQAASYRGHERIVKLLVEKGADVNARGGQYDNALQAASYRGHKGVVKLLLQTGADVNAMGGGNALSHGHETIRSQGAGYNTLRKI